MKSFNEIYQMVEESAHEAAFNRGESEAMYNHLLLLPDGARVVEIGVQYGRSSTIIAEIGKAKNFDYTAIDSYVEDVSPEAKAHFEGQIAKYGWKVHTLWMDSNAARELYAGPIDFIHIDGLHDYEVVLMDAQKWLPSVKVGGYAFFDDFGHDSLPGVWQACSEYFAVHPEWKFLGRYGDKLGIYQKRDGGK